MEQNNNRNKLINNNSFVSVVKTFYMCKIYCTEVL